jgi:integrase
MEARWQEINLDAKVWTLPAERTKAGREHRIPLSERTIEILREMGKAKSGEFVFPGRKFNRPLSNMAFEMHLRRVKSEFTAHGFRSSFRDWAGNETGCPRELEGKIFLDFLFNARLKLPGPRNLSILIKKAIKPLMLPIPDFRPDGRRSLNRLIQY